jgi:hypothetical protein
MFTRHSVDGFHYLPCTDKSFHRSAKKDSEKCGVKEIGLYHLLECQAKALTFAQAAKMKKKKLTANQKCYIFPLHNRSTFAHR